MGTVRFELRKTKLDKEGKAPILINYQLRGQRKYINTGKKMYPALWDLPNQRVIYLDKKSAKKILPLVKNDKLLSSKETESLNDFLISKALQIKKIEERFELDKIIYDSQMVVERMKWETNPSTKKSLPSNILFDFMDKYINDHLNTRAPGSLSVYKSVKKHLEDYCSSKKKVITFTDLDYSFFQDFQNFLLTPRKVYVPSKNPTLKGRWKSICLNNTTVAKQLSTIKTFINYAKVKGFEVNDKFKDFKIKKETLEVVALTNEEFEKLFYFDLSGSKKLGQTRDVFCFACATGLRYSDLAELKRENIRAEELRIIVKKTKEPLIIPLTPYSKAILERYERSLKPLPVISNQKLNDYIKELCERAEINEPIEIVRYVGSKRQTATYPKYKLIGVHTGRKTFATLSLEKGMSAEEVMTITGHKDYKSFKRYVNITEQRKKTVMLKAWGSELSIAKLKVV